MTPELKESIKGMVKMTEVKCNTCKKTFKKGDFAEYTRGGKFRCEDCMHESCSSKKVLIRSDYKGRVIKEQSKKLIVQKTRWCPDGCGKKVFWIPKLRSVKKCFQCSSCKNTYQKEDL